MFQPFCSKAVQVGVTCKHALAPDAAFHRNLGKNPGKRERGDVGEYFRVCMRGAVRKGIHDVFMAVLDAQKETGVRRAHTPCILRRASTKYAYLVPGMI